MVWYRVRVLESQWHTPTLKCTEYLLATWGMAYILSEAVGVEGRGGGEKERLPYNIPPDHNGCA